nr:hypothetical protein [Microctonus hyperodae filamentous virus]
MIAIFRALNFMDEDDAVMKCLTPSLEAKEKLAQIIRDTNQKIKNEAEPSTIAKRNTSGYSPEDIVRFINNYTFNFNNTFNIYNKVE